MSIAMPYKLGQLYRFVLLPHYVSPMPLITIGKVVQATNLELVLEVKDSSGKIYLLIVGRASVKTAEELMLCALPAEERGQNYG